MKLAASSCPVCRLVIAVLEQRLADALGNSAMRLTVQDQRIDGAPDIVDRSVADDFNLAGFGIDLDFADLRAIRKARDRKRLVGDAGERPLQILWQVLARDGGRGDLEDADLAIGAGDPVSAALELDVDFAGLEQEAGDLAALVDDVVGRLADDGRGQLHRAAGMRAATRRNPGGVVGDVSDALERHAKPFGDELREAGFVPLSRGHRAHHQLDPAFGKHGDLGALARARRW